MHRIAAAARFQAAFDTWALAFSEPPRQRLIATVGARQRAVSLACRLLASKVGVESLTFCMQSRNVRLRVCPGQAMTKSL